MESKNLHHTLSAELSSKPSANLDIAVKRGLRLIGEFLDFDRIILAEVSHDQKVFQNTYNYTSQKYKDLLTENIIDNIPWITDQILHGESLFLSKQRDYPPELPERERAFLLKRGIQSFYALPIKTSQSILGGIFFISLNNLPDLLDEQIEKFRYFSDVLTGVLERKRIAVSINELARFEKFLAEISATYINLPVNKIVKNIRNDFGRLSRLLGADRCMLFMFDEDINSYRFDVPFAWWPEEDNAVAQAHVKWSNEDPNLFEDCRYMFNKWRKGEHLQFTSIEELPDEAGQMKELYLRFGAKSGLSIPISVGGVPMGALNIANIRTPRTWPDELIQRLKVFGEIFLNAMVRKQSEERLQKAFSEIKQLKDRIEADYIYLKEETNHEHDFSNIVGKSDALKKILVKVKQVAPTNTTALLLGETGTGKGLIARAIHNVSKRKDRPFMQVNCAALAPSLIESELFGHEKGAFTGAQSRRSGRFELANGTTLFLDEIGELPLETQAKLLRVLEDGELERVGGTRTIKTDVRIIAATNRNLEKEVEEGRFRQDLWYRLNIFPITIPPLRERKEDIPLFLRFFIDKYGKWIGKKFHMISQKTILELQRYSWPGNVRELENMIEKAVIISHENKLWIELPVQDDEATPENQTLEKIERNHIINILESTGWKVKGPEGAAIQLGLNPSTLRSRMKKLNIDRPKVSHA